MENYITAELTYIIDDGQPSISYVDWPEEEHKAHILSLIHNSEPTRQERISYDVKC